MGIFEKMNWFGSPEKKEDNKKMDELLQGAEKILSETAEKEEAQINGAKEIIGNKADAEINGVLEKLQGMMEEGTEAHKKSINALMEDYGWTESMANQRLSMVFKALEEIRDGGFEAPDENKLNESTRDSRSVARDIIERKWGPAIVMEIGPLIDQILGSSVKQVGYK